MPANYTTAVQEENKMENNNLKEIPEYDFLKGKLTQTKALKTLCKLIRYNGEVMAYYKMIESFPTGLPIEYQNIYSSRAESGNMSKLCIGDHICNYKVEANYYKYLCNGGGKYSDYLAEVKQIQDGNEAVNKQRRKDQQAKEIIQYRKEHDDNIRFALTTPLDKFIEYTLGTVPQELEKYQKQGQTKFIKEIKYYESFISHRTKIAKEVHEITNRIYTLNGDTVEEKYNYDIGDSIILHQLGSDYHTVIEEKREGLYGYFTYKVRKVEGVVNTYCEYYYMLPENIE